MKTLTATQLKKNFGEIFELVHHGRVDITKSGIPRLSVVTVARMDELLEMEARVAERVAERARER